jgi:glyoxylase-like metal-dependent hydrolase (beta-lactamase superfamily II)
MTHHQTRTRFATFAHFAHFAMQPLIGALLVASPLVHAGPVEDAARLYKLDDIQSLAYSGTGRWFQFGQAPAPNLAWPSFDVSSYQAGVHFESASSRVQIKRLQTIDPARARPAPIEQVLDQNIRANLAWNHAVTPTGTASLQPAAVEERVAEIWSTPQGFLKAALAFSARTKKVKGGTEVSFKLDSTHRFEGLLDAQSQVTRVRTWLDSPVLGDTLVETLFEGQTEQGGSRFPAHIVRTQGGHPVLDLDVKDVQFNAFQPLAIPEPLLTAKAPVVTVTVTPLAGGVFYLTGGTHHSVAIAQKDHVVLVEAPLNESRAQAVVDKIKEVIPGKPIRYVVNTHAHFDHSGGLRTLVAEGATVVTHQDNISYYQKVWAQPHRIAPDRLAAKPVKPRFEGLDKVHTLNDGERKIEVYPLAGNTHNDAFVLVYLPAEKIAIEVDAYTPLAASAKPPATPNPYAVNLQANIAQYQLDVQQLVPLHGPGVVKLDDLKAYNGQLADAH